MGTTPPNPTLRLEAPRTPECSRWTVRGRTQGSCPCLSGTLSKEVPTPKTKVQNSWACPFRLRLWFTLLMKTFGCWEHQREIVGWLTRCVSCLLCKWTGWNINKCWRSSSAPLPHLLINSLGLPFPLPVSLLREYQTSAIRHRLSVSHQATADKWRVTRPIKVEHWALLSVMRMRGYQCCDSWSWLRVSVDGNEPPPPRDGVSPDQAPGER